MPHPLPDIPTATYRIQFNKHFTFRQARDIVPYLDELGISHVYASPYFNAGPDSLHGYDICDHNELNPVIGTREDYDAFVSALHVHGIGQIADFVPNHMGIASTLNTWWMDVLENGPSSVFASHFDIDWHPVKEELENKVLLPILGDQFGRVLEHGEFKLEFESGAFFIRYFETKLPVAPRSYALILRPALEQTASTGAKEDSLLELQSILTALEHLPGLTESEPAKLAERVREKEIVKKRLQRCGEECPQLVPAIEHAMRQMEGRPGEPRTFDAFDALLDGQAYRLSYWRVAAEEINHRRFFDINELAAIRVELPEVFEATHHFLFELIRSGALTGLRIDHVDGLWDPRGYLAELQRRTAEIHGVEESALPLYLIVEKILLGDEHLQANWPVHGTTGYDFTNEAAGLLIDPAARKSLTDTYARFTGNLPRFEDIIYRTKLVTMRISLASEINMLGRMLSRLAQQNRWYRDFTLNALTSAVRLVMACFPVYRTYVTPEGEHTETDRQAILKAVRLAIRHNPAVERSLFNFLGEILLCKFPENIGEAARAEHLRFVLKFQQISGAVMAKGVEDTAFYQYHRLTALNEVGGEPGQFGISPAEFMQRCIRRRQGHPHAMLATSTHDTKRSEDVRARIASLSELPDEWRAAVRRWQTLNHNLKKTVDGEMAPDANEEYLLYQTLLGTWPTNPMSAEERAGYVSRIQEYMIKAIKEAKINSSWIQPNEEWEAALRFFVEQILRPGPNRFLKRFEPLALQAAELGAINSLAQLVLKCTTPGVPDIYQGCETWDLSLVDPDNRRPVDYEARRAELPLLSGVNPEALFDSWQDGRIKLFITQSLLHLRRRLPRLFQEGDFTPLAASGTFAEHCVAFLRRVEGGGILVITPRLTRRLKFRAVGDVWADTRLEMEDAPGLTEWKNVFTGAALPITRNGVGLSEALQKLPVAVFASGQ